MRSDEIIERRNPASSLRLPWLSLINFTLLLWAGYLDPALLGLWTIVR
jgi:hypothetical protein